MERVFTPAGRDLFDQLAPPVTRGGGADNGGALAWERLL